MKKFGFIFFALIILVMSWEDQKSVASIFSAAPIPQESIRLRIIANSDLPEDQALKRAVRDQVNAYLSTKVGSLQTMNQAEGVINKELPKIQQIVDETVANRGFDYKTNVELGVVPFPTKMYGQYVYPAGEYEALRVTIGAGQGQNWWCVLFPPLCFVDISNGDAVAKKKDSATKEVAAGADGKAPQIEVKFFLVEFVQKVFAAIFG
ncbi:MAG TPA: stage II sporulation protein R [Bacillota bacterium]|nr:stage II sporulation protein R [Bacillota bacterium]